MVSSHSNLQNYRNYLYDRDKLQWCKTMYQIIRCEAMNAMTDGAKLSRGLDRQTGPVAITVFVFDPWRRADRHHVDS